MVLGVVLDSVVDVDVEVMLGSWEVFVVACFLVLVSEADVESLAVVVAVAVVDGS